MCVSENGTGTYLDYFSFSSLIIPYDTMRLFLLLALVCFAAATENPTLSSPAGALAMLTHAVSAMKENKASALKAFDDPKDARFTLGDMSVICFSTVDGSLLAGHRLHPENPRGKDIRGVVDDTGDAFGQRIFDAAKEEGKFEKVAYRYPKPHSPSVFLVKEAYVARIGADACFVGYWEGIAESASGEEGKFREKANDKRRACLRHLD